MNDLFWGYVRQIISIVGTALIVRYLSIPEDQAASIVRQIVDLLLGPAMIGGSLAWMTLVRANTMSVPVATGKRSDVPTVSPVTGQVDPATTPRK